MSNNRRDFIGSSIAITILTVSKAGAQATKKIGLVHSTAISNTDFLSCFLAGLDSRGYSSSSITHAEKDAKGEYYGSDGTTRHKKLRQLIKDHGSVDLIVAGGGLVSQASASEELSQNPFPHNIPYVYLGGRAANPPASQTYCGVNLNTSDLQQGALKRMLGGNGPWPTACLVQNYNSEMVDAEAYDWSSNVGGNVFQFFEPASGNTTNNSNNYSSEVARLKTKFSSIAAVVVSSDPYFRSTASTFAKAIQALGNVPICYPFEDFPLSGHNIKLPGGARLSSKTFTDADTAYYQLGLRAADVLDDPHPNNNNPFKSATWNWNVSMQTGSWAVA